MADLYNANPSQYGGFDSPFPGSSSKGYYEKALGVPFTIGKSILATIPEYQRNPFQFEKDMAITVIAEGRANLMKLLLEEIEKGNFLEVNDVRYRFPIEIKPQQKIYLAEQTVPSINSAGITKIKIESNKTKIATSHPQGNPKNSGDIARLEAGQYALLMFSWVNPDRTSGVYYNPAAHPTYPMPEIVYILEVDYNKSEIKVQRNWAGSKRTSYTYNTTNVPNFEVVPNTTTAVWGTTGVKVPQKFAFLIPMARAMKEDDINGQIKMYTGTWADGVVQRNLFVYGSQHMAEVIAKNLGLPSRLTATKQEAIEQFFGTWEYTALFGQASESYDENGYWMGTTDGVLSKIPKSHYIAIKGIDWSSGFVGGDYSIFGSFNVYTFNRIMQGKAYYGSQNKKLICGADFYSNFVTMLNFMTQSVPDIKSEWQVTGKKFTTSDGLVIDVVPSDAMTLNGMSNMGILYDPQYFKAVKLRNYPTMDMQEVSHENPLIQTGFIHGIKGFIDLNPDAHWVFTVVDKKLPDGTDNTALYNSIDPLGQPLE